MFEITKATDSGNQIETVYFNQYEEIVVDYLAALAIANIKINSSDFYFYERGNRLEVGKTVYQIKESKEQINPSL